MRGDGTPASGLRCGYTTGACATAAAAAAWRALLTDRWRNPVSITLPKGQAIAFSLAAFARGQSWARAEVIKDAGDDPDVTHGARIGVLLRGTRSGGVTFHAGEGVGVVTRRGLPLSVGEPAINPVPRAMMRTALEAIARECGVPCNASLEIFIPGGEALARKTWNERLGIVGGLSILGTTGIVRPYSCSAWIASIQRGIDVARAGNATHIGAATGATSQGVLHTRYGLEEWRILDMGDFIGGTLAYLRRHPVPRLTIAGGFGKMVKFAQGAHDLHSGRSQVKMPALAQMAEKAGLPRHPIARAGSAAEALSVGGTRLAGQVARLACAQARRHLGDAPIAVDIMLVDRAGAIVGRYGAAGE